MTDLTEAQQQAQAALEKVMNCRFNNFDAGAVIHWAERGFYQVKAEAASSISQQDAELERLRREVEELRDAKWQAKHVDTMNDIASLRIALEGAEAALAEARKAAFIEAAEIAGKLFTAEFTPQEPGFMRGIGYAAQTIFDDLRAKAEETRT